MSTRRGTALRKFPVPPGCRETRLLTRSVRPLRYFCNPNFTSHIEAIPGTFATESDKKYPGINSGDYLVQRLTATY